jgi:BRO family, N-terminal domain
MNQQNKVVLFTDKSIRSHWDAELEEWFFSVVDVVAALTDSANPTDYLKKLRKRDAQLGAYLGTNCPQVAMLTATGKTRKALAATTQQLLRIIQSIPSKKAEPFKLWLAEVGNQRLDQLQDPELSIEHLFPEAHLAQRAAALLGVRHQQRTAGDAPVTALKRVCWWTSSIRPIWTRLPTKPA